MFVKSDRETNTLLKGGFLALFFLSASIIITYYLDGIKQPKNTLKNKIRKYSNLLINRYSFF
jgi:hypothetical protein